MMIFIIYGNVNNLNLKKTEMNKIKLTILLITETLTENTFKNDNLYLNKILICVFLNF